MDRTADPRDASVTDLPRSTDDSDEEVKSEVDPDSWRDLIEFVDQFNDVAVFRVLDDPEDGAERSNEKNRNREQSA